jgi:hypothetical protein
VVSFHFAWTQLIFPTWQIQLPPYGLLIQLLTLSSMMVLAQAVLWSLHAFPWLRLFALAIGLTGCGILGIAVPSDDFRQISPGALATTLVGILIVGWTSAILGVARDRRGEWQGWTGKVLSQVIDALPTRKKGFASAASAQFWYEWRRKGFLTLATFALPLGLAPILLLLGPLLLLDHPTVTLLISGIPLLGLVFGSCLGQGLAKFDYLAPHGVPLFAATRPINTGSMLMAKLQVAGVVTIAGYALAALLAPLSISITSRWIPDLPPWSVFYRQYGDILTWFAHPLVIALILAATWQSMVTGLAIGLFGNPRKILVASLAELTILAVTLSAGFWAYRHPEWAPASSPILLVAAVLISGWKVLRTALSFRSAQSQGIFTSRQRLSLAAIWSALGVVVVAAAYHLYASGILSGAVAFFAAACLLPGPALPNCALRLSKDRHR